MDRVYQNVYMKTALYEGQAGAVTGPAKRVPYIRDQTKNQRTGSRKGGGHMM